MTMEQEAQVFVTEIAKQYLLFRDVDALLTQMHSGIVWTGLQSADIRQGLPQTEQALRREFDNSDTAFAHVRQALFGVPLSESVCMVYGSLQAVPKQAEQDEQTLTIHATCLTTDDGMRLVQCAFAYAHCLHNARSAAVPSQHGCADYAALRTRLESKERGLQNLTRDIPGGVHQCRNNPQLTLTSMSDSFLELFGYTKEDIETRFENEYIRMIHPDDREQVMQSLREQLSGGTVIELEYRVISKHRGLVWILDMGKLLQDETGETCFCCVLVEITQRKRVQEELRLSLERHQIIMDQAADIIFEWDIFADTLSFSSNWHKKFGYEPIVNNISVEIPLSKNIHPQDIPAFVKIMHDIASGVPYCETEFRICDITGLHHWSRIRATAQFDQNGRAIKAVGVITDISAEKEERMALLEQAQKDALTGLYNKAAVRTRVEQIMSERRPSQMQAMLIIDVDYFKRVNDVYGHLCGDTLLSDVAEVLKRSFRASDLIGRIGGDEFLVYMAEVSDQEIVRKKVDNVLKALAKVRPHFDAPPVTCSVGAAVLPRKGMKYFTLYQAADRALYHRKSVGRNGLSFYEPGLCAGDLAWELAQSAVSDSIDSEQCSAVEQKLAQYTFQMLYQSIDVKTAVNQLLEIVGRAYGVSRVYIFESSEDGLSCNNTFEWCAPGIASEIENLQGIRYEEDLGGYLQNFNEDGVFYCHDIHTLHPSLYQVLAPQGIRSLLQCAVLDRGQFKGYVGFDECGENCIWSKDQIRSLTLVANVLSVFLMKLRLEERLEEQAQKSDSCAPQM